MAGKFGLGKGLGALLPSEEVSSGVVELSTDAITYSPYQPRTALDEAALQELAQSIKKSGVIQPIVVRRVRNGFELIAGERRLRAARLAGFEKIPVVIREISDIDAAEFALVENIQREDLNPIDIARAMKRLREEFGYTQESIADGIKKSRPYVANLLRLLDLPDIVQDAILKGTISEGHGRTILPLKDEGLMLGMMQRIITSQMSVRETEKAVKKIQEETPTERPQPREEEKAHEAILAETALRETLGTKVRVLKDKIEIEYYGREDLERICEVIAK